MVGHDVKLQPAWHEACGLVSKQIMEYARSQGMKSFFGGSYDNHLQGMLGMFAVDQVLYKLGKWHTFDASIGRTDHFDMLINNRRFEIKSGKVPSFEVLADGRYMAQVPKTQFDSGRGIGVEGYIFPMIDDKMENCKVMGWIETIRVMFDDYGNPRHIITWTGADGKNYQSYRVPFFDLNGMGAI